jgi:EAL domain-containing protein (putative c-di-GMP-specific phosphodiesterase class I)
MGRHFPLTVAAIIDETQMDPGALILELTEGIFIRDAERAIAVLADLKALGVRVALDDFGTGYSSLSYLRQFPVDILKIDQSFVATSAGDFAGRAIIGAITELAHQLGLSVIAEGVETQSQRETVAQVGCDLAQGYHYAPAMRLQELDAAFRESLRKPLHLPAPRGPGRH